MKHPTLKRLATLALALALFLKPLGILALQVAPEHNFTISLPFDSAGQPITRLDIRFYWTPGLTFLSGSSTSMGSMTVSNYGGTALGTFTTGTAVTSGSVILQFKAQPDADEEQAVLVEGITGADTVSGEGNIHAGMSGRHEILVSLDNETWPDEWILDTPATHDAPGQEHRVSSLGRYEYRTIPTLEIIWSEWTVITPASYDAEGLERRVNSLDANQFEERAIPKLPLVWGEWTVITPATCDLPGLERRVNTLDTAMSETREIPALGHAAAEWVISKLPTFTEPGRKNLVCPVDGAILASQTLPIQALPEWTSGSIGIDGTAFTLLGDEPAWGAYRQIRLFPNEHTSFRLVARDGTIMGRVHMNTNSDQVTFTADIFSPFQIQSASAKLFKNTLDFTDKTKDELKANSLSFDVPHGIKAVGGQGYYYLSLDVQAAIPTATATHTGGATAVGGVRASGSLDGNGSDYDAIGSSGLNANTGIAEGIGGSASGIPSAPEAPASTKQLLAGLIETLKDFKASLGADAPATTRIKLDLLIASAEATLTQADQMGEEALKYNYSNLLSQAQQIMQSASQADTGIQLIPDSTKSSMLDDIHATPKPHTTLSPEQREGTRVQTGGSLADQLAGNLEGFLLNYTEQPPTLDPDNTTSEKMDEMIAQIQKSMEEVQRSLQQLQLSTAGNMPTATPAPSPVPTVGGTAGSISALESTSLSTSGSIQLNSTNQYSGSSLLASVSTPTPAPIPTPVPTPTPTPLSLEDRLKEKLAAITTPTPEEQQRLSEYEQYRSLSTLATTAPQDDSLSQQIAQLEAEIAGIQARLKELSNDITPESLLQQQMLMQHLNILNDALMQLHKQQFEQSMYTILQR